MLKTIQKNLPILTIAILLISYYDIYTFYRNFGIEIYHYLETTEIIFSQSSILVSVVALISGYLIAYGIGRNFFSISKIKSEPAIPETPTIQSELSAIQQFLTPLARNTRLITIIALAILMGAIVLFIFIFHFYYLSELEFIILFVAIGFFYFGLMKLFTIKRIQKNLQDGAYKDGLSEIEKYFKFSGHYLILFISILALLSFKNLFKSSYIKDGKSKFSVSVDLRNQETICSSDSLHYIGATRNYIFFYNNHTKKVKSIPERDVISIEVEELRGGF